MAIFRFFFSKWWQSAILNLLSACLDHPQRVLVVFLTVQNLVRIDAVVSIVMQVLIFNGFGLKMSILAPN